MQVALDREDRRLTSEPFEVLRQLFEDRDSPLPFFQARAVIGGDLFDALDDAERVDALLYVRGGLEPLDHFQGARCFGPQLRRVVADQVHDRLVAPFITVGTERADAVAGQNRAGYALVVGRCGDVVGVAAAGKEQLDAANRIVFLQVLVARDFVFGSEVAVGGINEGRVGVAENNVVTALIGHSLVIGRGERETGAVQKAETSLSERSAEPYLVTYSHHMIKTTTTNGSTVSDAEVNASTPVYVIFPEVLPPNSIIQEQPEFLFHIDLNPETGWVTISETTCYDGAIVIETRERLRVELGSTTGVTDLPALKEEVEQLRGDIAIICDGFENVGDFLPGECPYTLAAEAAIERVRHKMHQILATYVPRITSVENWCDSYLDDLAEGHPVATERIITLPVGHPEVQELIDDMAWCPGDIFVVPDRDLIEEYVDQWLEERRDRLEVEAA